MEEALTPQNEMRAFSEASRGGRQDEETFLRARPPDIRGSVPTRPLRHALTGARLGLP